MSKHGHAVRGRPLHPLYSTWSSMRNRCSNPNVHNYDRYESRGIKVCKRWDSFTNFINDMGPRPDKHTLDRINNNGNYTPSNCKWANWKTQLRNSRRRKHIYKGLGRAQI